VEIQSTGSLHADALVQSASSQSSFSQTGADRLDPVNQLFDITGSSGILAALQQFSTAFSSLSVTPNDTSLRTTALAAAGNVASAFRKVASSLDNQKADVDSTIQTTVASINRLAGQIRQFNVSIRSQSQVDAGTDAGLRSSLDQLASLTDISVLKNADGTVSVLTGGQQPLVLGDQAYSLSANLSAAPGSQISSSGGGSSPSSYSGQLGALLDIRNGSLQTILGGGGASGSLNDLAKGFASRVNALFAGGVAADGTPGVPLFTYDSGDDSNVARTLALDPAVTPDELALSTTGASPQSNGIATRLAALPASSQAADQISGFSPQGLFASIAAGIGQQLSDARNQSSTDATALTSAQAYRQQTSGVSLDQEAVAITAYQRSYEASAKLVSILDQLTSDAVNLIR
jgi:flagellar hook-associated protein 1 FlgK